MRFLSILFNPIGNLTWWIAKTLGGGIDRRLGPKAGWLLAFVLVLLSALTLVGAVYATGDNILKLTGMRARDAVTIAEGRVVSVETTRRKTLTVEQVVVAEFAGNDGPQRLEGRLSKTASEEYVPGDTLQIYVSPDGTPSFRNPEDPFLDAVMVVLGTGVPLIALVFSLKYLRHRRRLLPLTQPVPAQVAALDTALRERPRGNEVVVRGGQRVKSYAERQKEDADMIRRMHEKADKRK